MRFVEFGHGAVTYRLTDAAPQNSVVAAPLPEIAAHEVLRAALAAVPTLEARIGAAFADLAGDADGKEAGIATLIDRISELILQHRMALLVVASPAAEDMLESVQLSAAPGASANDAIHPLAIKLMHEFEGCRLKAYLPTPIDRPTIGWGMTFYPDGRKVKMGETISQAQADTDFVAVVEQFAKRLRAVIGDAATSRRQFGAMVALAYNIGEAGFSKSTVLRKHKAADHAAAASAFVMWNKQGPNVLAGLTRRRKAEAALYLSSD